jgi:hypothetical protein
VLVEERVDQDSLAPGDLIRVVVSTSETPDEDEVGVFIGWKRYTFDLEKDIYENVCVCMFSGVEHHLFLQDIERIDNE